MAKKPRTKEEIEYFQNISSEVIGLIDHVGGVAKFIRKLRHHGVYIARSTVTSWYYGKKVPTEWSYKALKKAYFPTFSIARHRAKTQIDVDSLLS